MKITNDLNNNSDFLSVSNNGDESTSSLGSLFSINFNNNEAKSNDIADDFEFIFKKEDIGIIEYLSDILPNLNITSLSSADLERIKNEIQSDQTLVSDIRDKIFSFLDAARNNNRNILIKFHKYYNYKEMNSDVEDNKVNSEKKNKSIKGLTPAIKSLEQSIDKSGVKSPETNIFKKNSFSLTKLDNHQVSTSANKEINFVKKIKKNNHPNKIYKKSNTNSFQYKEKIDSKLSNKINDVYSQNSGELKNKIMNEIKANDKVLNIQNSIESGNKGNQFSQQNNASLNNGGFNSVLEGLLETLDLTQKGWTSKLISRIENAMSNSVEDIEFNLKPKNLGRLKVSISLKNGIGSVKIITENTFVTNALIQNENHLQKLFNDQGINLEFTAHDETKYSDSKNGFNKNSNNNNKNNLMESENEQEQTNIITGLDEDNSPRHIVNVIA